MPVCPTEPQGEAAGDTSDMTDGGAAAGEQCRVSGLALGKGGSGTAASPRVWLCPTITKGTFTDGCVPMEGLHCLQAMLPQQLLDNDGFALMTNSGSHMLLIILSFAFSYALPLPRHLFLSDSAFIFIDLLAMLRGEWTGIQGFKQNSTLLQKAPIIKAANPFLISFYWN